LRCCSATTAGRRAGPGSRRLADHLAPDATQILDWHHAVEHAVDCGKAVLGDESPYLPQWQRRAEQLLAAGEPDKLIAELMECQAALDKRGRDRAAASDAIDDLVRYYTTNADRMEYAWFRLQDSRSGPASSRAHTGTFSRPG
jgi:hypothetical protein